MPRLRWVHSSIDDVDAPPEYEVADGVDEGTTKRAIYIENIRHYDGHLLDEEVYDIEVSPHNILSTVVYALTRCVDALQSQDFGGEFCTLMNLADHVARNDGRPFTLCLASGQHDIVYAAVNEYAGFEYANSRRCVDAVRYESTDWCEFGLAASLSTVFRSLREVVIALTTSPTCVIPIPVVDCLRISDGGPDTPTSEYIVDTIRNARVRVLQIESRAIRRVVLFNDNVRDVRIHARGCDHHFPQMRKLTCNGWTDERTDINDKFPHLEQVTLWKLTAMKYKRILIDVPTLSVEPMGCCADPSFTRDDMDALLRRYAPRLLDATPVAPTQPRIGTEMLAAALMAFNRLSVHPYARDAFADAVLYDGDVTD